ncbi:MAG: peptide chain release factor 2 [Bacilli bacterium]|nr:peptide chain release factor 2 [Bacilli bacterium]MDY4053016.1 peptide chain release factor 2 [Bacilli bacterium]
MEKFEIVKAYEDFKTRLNDLEKVLQIPILKAKIQENDQAMSSPTFWDNPTLAAKFLQENNENKEKIKTYENLKQELDELNVVLELDDESLYDEAEEIVKKLSKKIEKFENEQLLNEPYDHMNAILELHPGAGGTEAQDWALMLYRMYKRYAERNHFDFELLDYEEANDAGIKSATFVIKGKNAYGILKGEKGVHRLVRISPFDSNARRHTSFVALNVTPEIDNTIDVEINPDDLKIDTYRSSGAGGQHINKTDSAVRITHLPTGIVVSCQNQRSQIQNREKAMQILKSKLYQLEMEKQEKMLKSIGGELSDNAFGSQIRSYVLHPYSMVKDHRTNVESSNPTNVLDGDIDIFIDAYLKYNKDKEK